MQNWYCAPPLLPFSLSTFGSSTDGYWLAKCFRPFTQSIWHVPINDLKHTLKVNKLIKCTRLWNIGRWYTWWWHWIEVIGVTPCKANTSSARNGIYRILLRLLQIMLTVAIRLWSSYDQSKITKNRLCIHNSMKQRVEEHYRCAMWQNGFCSKFHLYGAHLSSYTNLSTTKG